MMKLKSLFTLTLACCASGAWAQSQSSHNPAWLDTAVFYQIYPSTYMDSDGNGIGDLRGIISRLDYVKSVGVDAIWFNPVFLSGWQDGGYDIMDFYRIDPRFGTNSDMVDLIQAAHERGLKIVLDLVAGHTSNRCAWFTESAQADSNLRYSDYYIWTNQISQEEKVNIVRRHQSDNPQTSTIGRFVEANSPRAKYYEKNFYESQPALNYGYAHPNPNHSWEQSVDAEGPKATRQELKNILAFWMGKGVDGFRVDMASSLIKNDYDQQENVRLWSEIRSWMDANYPNRVLISEWSNPENATAGGFNADFMLPWGDNGYATLFMANGNPRHGCNALGDCFFDLAGKGQVAYFADRYEASLSRTQNKGYIAIPTTNHDFPRLNIAGRDTPQQLKVAMTFFLTMPGVPFIYYGDEIGMKFIHNLPNKEGSNDDNNERAGSRTPMQWADGPTAGFSSCTPNQLYYPVDTEKGKLTVEAQERDAHSLLNYVRRLNKLRHSSKALSGYGKWELVSDKSHPYPMVYKRTYQNETYLIALNPSDKNAEALLPKQIGNPVEMLLCGKSVYRKNGKKDVLRLAPVSAVVYKIGK